VARDRIRRIARRAAATIAGLAGLCGLAACPALAAAPPQIAATWVTNIQARLSIVSKSAISSENLSCFSE
jgi:hypothetical protein